MPLHGSRTARLSLPSCERLLLFLAALAAGPALPAAGLPSAVPVESRLIADPTLSLRAVVASALSHDPAATVVEARRAESQVLDALKQAGPSRPTINDLRSAALP